MIKVIFDLPSTPICISEIQINPLTSTSSDPTNPQQQPQFCLTLAILLLPYGYLLYWYISSLYALHTKSLLSQLDTLDISLTILSILRLCMMFLIPIIQHQNGIMILNILTLWWEIVLMFIFVKFIVEERKKYQLIVWGTFVFYIVFILIWNYLRNWKQNNEIYQNYTVFHIPVFYPLLLVTLTLTIISVFQLISIQSSLTHSLLTPTITIQLKTRKSFIFLTLTSCWIALFMKKYPQIFKPILGVVLYFIICQWINMAISYRMIVDRIIRRNQDEDMQSQNGGRGRQSGVILVEMKGFGSRR